MVTNRQISEAFSKGSFEFAYDYFAADIRWDVIGDRVIEGKDEVVAACNRMLGEINASELINTNVIESGDSIAVEGCCKYINAQNKAGEVRYCDIYLFENNRISRITSYCISFLDHNITA